MEQQITLETLHQRIDSLQELLMNVLDLLSKEKKKQSKENEERDDMMSMPPISNYDAAQLLLMSTRQLQRVRRKYKLIWEERGREVYYHLTPIIKAIRNFNLHWNQSVLEKLMSNYKKLPEIR